MNKFVMCFPQIKFCGTPVMVLFTPHGNILNHTEPTSDIMSISGKGSNVFTRCLYIFFSLSL